MSTGQPTSDHAVTMLHEAPEPIKAGALCTAAEEIVRWICEEERLTKGPWVCGVYGGRGSGKTSVLLTVLELLQALPDTEEVRLPKIDPENTALSPTAALFSPTSIRDHDDLFFLLRSVPLVAATAW